MAGGSRWALEMAKGLKAAHDKEISTATSSPENIMFTTAGSSR